MTQYWKVWLDNGRPPMSSDDSTPEQVPVDGVIAILQFHPDGQHEVLTGQDYVYWVGDMWISGSLSDMDKWLRRDMPLIKRGRWTTREEFIAALNEANAQRLLLNDGSNSR